MLIRSHIGVRDVRRSARPWRRSWPRRGGCFRTPPNLSSIFRPGSIPIPIPCPRCRPRFSRGCRIAPAIRRLAAIAAQCYGAPVGGSRGARARHANPAAAGGGAGAAGRAAILRTTYAEHVRAATLAGHSAAKWPTLDQLRGADLAIVVNPNNPDGRIVPRAALLSIADELRRRGGLLIVDEAFADVVPAEQASPAKSTRGNIVVLRSFGKFFGLAGLRLGFALGRAALGRTDRCHARSVGRCGSGDFRRRAGTGGRSLESGRRSPASPRPASGSIACWPGPGLKLSVAHRFID